VSAEVVFLTLFLGLIAGRQPVEMQVGEAVTLLRLFVDGQPAATLTAPPWRATVDLGANLQPRELLAVGYGSDGDEVGRASQVINLPRPLAEFTIGWLASNNGASPTIALRWEHVLAAKPSRATISVDGTPLEVDAEFERSCRHST